MYWLFWGAHNMLPTLSKKTIDFGVVNYNVVNGSHWVAYYYDHLLHVHYQNCLAVLNNFAACHITPNAAKIRHPPTIILNHSKPPLVLSFMRASPFRPVVDMARTNIHINMHPSWLYIIFKSWDLCCKGELIGKCDLIAFAAGLLTIRHTYR